MSPRQRPRRPAIASVVSQRRHRPDYWLLMISTALVVVGLVVIYAISPGLAAQNNVGQGYYVSKQLVAIVMGLVAFVVMSNVPIKFWQTIQKPLIGMALLAALAVRLFGQQVNGAYRWIQVGGISFQAAELIKFALLIWLASFLVERIRQSNLADLKISIKPMIIAIGLIGIVVGKVQSDFGSTAVMIAMMAAMAFVAGMPMKRVFAFGGIIAILGVLLIAPSSYRRGRVMTYLHPESDCQDAGYQVCQALLTVGSGGMFGLGVANSVQAYGYLPEAANDSIFAILAEKFGFVGVTALIALFAAFFRRLFKIAEQAPTEYARLLVVGILAWLSTQVLINVGAMLGLLPLKGITLPLISYGGTSMLFVLGAIGLVFQISRYTTYQPVGISSENDGRDHEGSTYRRGDRRPHYAATRRRPEA